MSLAAVAGSDFSRAFLNQVELGRAQPSTHSLQVIARRLQQPIDYFLEGPEVSAAAIELSLAEAELRLHQGDTSRAESLMTTILSRQIPQQVRTRAQMILAGALIRRGAASDAMPVLTEAVAAAERSDAPNLLAELYDWQGRAYYAMRRPHEAGRCFDQAFDLYQAAGLTDPVLKARILGHRANLHYVAGQPEEAIASYSDAIAAAEQVLDLPALAGIYEGLAMSFQQTGQYPRALSYAQKSLRIFETLQDVRMTGQLRLSMADMLLRQGRAAEAEAVFTEGAAQLRRLGERELLPMLVAGMAEAALEQAALDRAASLVDDVIDLATRSSDPIARVAAHRVAARVHHAQGRLETAHRHFEHALAVANGVDSPELRARVAYDYARALEAEGDTRQAAARFRAAYEAGQPVISGLARVSST
ncbi:MAG: tetratricopeptide repeat protein [Candidatus Dormibacteraeota bacterium]|nr:tetratricopeptide repeat protein [Candidatus Dormibacteraeota bacterium]